MTKTDFINIDGLIVQIKEANEKGLLRKLSNFASEKGINRTMSYQLKDKKEIDVIEIDGVLFVIMNQKAEKYFKKVYR